MFIQDDAAAYDAVFAGIGQNQLRLAGPDLIYGRLFDKIGFGAVRTSDDEIFKILVVTRLYRPGSKLKTLRYMAYFRTSTTTRIRSIAILTNSAGGLGVDTKVTTMSNTI